MTAAQFLEGCHPYICAASVWHVLSSSGAKRKYLIFICLPMTWNDEWGIIENAWLQKLNFKMKFQYDSPPSNSIFKRVGMFLLDCHYLAVRQLQNPPLRPLPSVVTGLQACRLPAVKPLPSVVKGVQACRLPALKRLQPSAAASTRHSGHCPLLLRAFKPAVCQSSGHCPLLLRAFKPAASRQATALCS